MKFNIDDIQFAQCPILKPTGVSIMMQNQQQHRECRYSMINIELESLYLTADFKDIDLMFSLVVLPAAKVLAPPPAVFFS